ncbi:MAG: hypothetical protein ACYDC0_07285 [Acidimicrobiales bacterium]
MGAGIGMKGLVLASERVEELKGGCSREQLVGPLNEEQDRAGHLRGVSRDPLRGRARRAHQPEDRNSDPGL